MSLPSLHPGLRLRTDGGAYLTLLDRTTPDPVFGWPRWMVRPDGVSIDIDVDESYLLACCRSGLTLVGRH